MLNIAILGSGAISDSHIAAYLKRPDRARPDQAKMVALVNLFPEKAAEKAARHGLQVKIFKTFDELLAGCEFDAASICLPPYEHAAGGHRTASRANTCSPKSQWQPAWRNATECSTRPVQAAACWASSRRTASRRR